MSEFKTNKNIVEKLGFNPYYKIIQSGLNNNIIINNNEFINLAANNYLGIANDHRIKEAAIDAINKYGLSLCGTPIATGYIELFKRVEEEISSFVGLDDTLIFPSCYQANNGLFSSLIDKDDIVIVDHYAHSSLIQGIKNTDGKITPFLHNNTDHLERVLKDSDKFKKRFVVTESVFSTEGSIAPAYKINELCNKYDAILVIDDSHGIGVIGDNGRGIIEYSKIKNFNGIYTASLGKALANSGGVICSKKEMIEYLRYNIPHLIYSTAIVPSVLGGVLKALEIVKNDFINIKQKMWSNKNTIYNILKQEDFKIIDSKTPINSISGGSREKTLTIAKLFYEENILVTPFIEPSVPPNKGVVRLIAQANLSDDIMESIIKKIEEIGIRYNEMFYDN
jgi:glycine C-acetyltransferase